MNAIRPFAIALVLLTAMAGGSGARAAPVGALHVPSPDWRDQVIYFLMIDRFNDGNPGNNDQSAGEFDPSDGTKYSGGDLAGIRQRLDYIRGLGATAVWITPPVANQWWSEKKRFSGYHGYWAADFMAVDAHYGTLDEYQRLSRELHAAGMYLVQDVVVNHVGNFFSYEGGWDAGDPARHFVLDPNARGRTAPTQPPFDRNDARKPDQREAGIYHWTPDIVDFSDREQEQTWQLAGLDDLNTENPVVRAALRRSYGYWIDAVGVDGFRVDTAFHAPPPYFADFMYADDPAQPGIMRVAERTGRKQFHVFGEGFGIDKPFDDRQMRKIDSYMQDNSGRALLPGMIHFPLYGSLGDVFARGRPTAQLAYRIERTMQLHRQPHLMPTFIDNHDVDRFLAGGGQAGLKQALLAIMTLPGIPTIYYGTEQAFVEQRGAMFKAGFGSGGRDRFDTQAPLYRFLREATALRRQHPLFSRGTPQVLKANAAGPGVLAWRMRHQNESALVVFNSADAPALLDRLDTGLEAGTVLQPLFSIEGDAIAGEAGEVVVGAQGRLTLQLPARAGLVLKATARKATSSKATRSDGRTAIAIAIDAGAAATVDGDFDVGGTARGVPELKLVVDGDLAAAQTVRVGRDGRWRARVDTAAMIDPEIPHEVVAWAPTAQAVSAAHAFRVQRQWTLLAEVDDPVGDDRGPSGRYAYPTDPGWSVQRPLDLHGVRVYGAGGAIRIELRMNALSKAWNPANDFDHVAFTLFLQLPGVAGGSAVMPLQNATLPGGMKWHYRLRAHGWSNTLFDAHGASATEEGRTAIPAADIVVDHAASTVSFTLPAAALGRPASLSGARLYVTTWDYDGGYRALAPIAQGHVFGGGDGAVDPLVLDDTAVIELP